ncbi:coiled-coil domain-containing protein [Alistipes putredinis]|uniref:Uncharacterized protein n=1 Tax=Alistipes putredinis DSM 17216 TaxID=445970 RepID=B0MXB1_9BACT|nr:hypothetical protein [Alistipes putredinis]EDS02131.1 hypothetical protein ALIPUT_01650 [Alistipes putredinis DSM 17216]
MSALSFKINAETDKLNSFITSLERLKQVLATIPSGTKEFDVVNKKIAEMEARVEQSIKRITQMQNEAAKTVSQTEPQSLSTPSSTASTAGAQAANAEAEAWRGLLDELHAVSLAKRENIEQIEQLKAANRGLKAQYDALNKAEQNGFALTDKQIARRTSLSLTYEENKQAISRMRQEVANQIKLEQVAHGSIDEMSQALARMRTVYRSLNEGERGNTFGQNLLKNIQALDTKIKELDASMGVHARNVGNYASGWNGLSFSIQQVARELPSLAISPQTFFLAISNNLPILADQLALTRQRVKELKAEGQSFTPVWKQVIKSIISWQTLLVAGITVLTLYGKEITEWVGSLFKGKQAFDAAKQAAEQFHATMTEGAISAQAEITKLDLLYRAATNVAKPYNERKKAVERLQEIYPAYFGNMSEEQIMVGNAISAYNNLRDAIIEAAQARAAMDDITELQGQKITIEYLPEYQQLFGTKQQYNAILMRGRLKGQTDEEYTALLQSYVKAMDEAQKAAEKTLEKNNNELYKKFKESGAKYLTEYVDSLNQQSEYLLHTAEKLYTSSTWEENNAEAEAARRKAEQDAQKAASQQEKNLNDLAKAIQKLRDDALQAEIDSMKDGTEKRVAQIELDYQRRAEAINEAEQRIIELQGKLTQKQEELFAQLRQVNDNRRKNERHEAIAGPPIDTNFAEYWKKEQADWDEYYMKYGTFREKMQATKDYYDRKMAEATTEGARAAIQAERDAALAVFEVQASDWAKEIVNLSVKNLEELLSEAEAQLAAAEAAYDALASSGTQEAAGYIDTINKLKARIAVLKSLLGKTKKEVSDSNWAEGARLLNELSATAREAANALSEFDEGLGKAATFIATMASAAGNLIATIEGVTDAASAAGAEMSALEKASVVLTAISAGFQLIQGAFSLFGGGESSWERNIRLAHEFNEELRLMNERVKINAEEFSNIFGKDEYGAFIQNIEVARKALKDYEESLEEIKKRGEEKNGFPGEGTISYTGLSQLYKYEKEWESAAESIANMQVQTRHSTWFRSAKYASLGDLIPELFDENGSLNMEALKKFAEEGGATFQHLSGENQEMIQNLVANWDTYQEALEASNNYLSDLFNNLGNTLADALVDAWESGADAADAFGEAAGDMLKQLAKDIIYTATIAPAIEKAKEQIKSINENESLSDEERFGAITETINTILDDVIAQQAIGEELWETLKKLAAEKGLDWEESVSTQSATSRGFQAMSQDTGSELNGRFTDIQGKVTDIRGYVMTETQSIIGLISSITSIQIAVIRNVQINNELLQYAVKTYLEVAEINATTQAMNDTLTYIREDITAIKRNTANI